MFFLSYRRSDKNTFSDLYKEGIFVKGVQKPSSQLHFMQALVTEVLHFILMYKRFFETLKPLHCQFSPSVGPEVSGCYLTARLIRNLVTGFLCSVYHFSPLYCFLICHQINHFIAISVYYNGIIRYMIQILKKK